jgi:EamA domain-containing membrane protein RarD
MFDSNWKLAREIARKYMKAHSLSGMVIEIAIAVLVLAILLGVVAFPIFFSTNTTAWGANNILIWGVVPTVSLAVIIIALVSHFKHRGAE